MTARVRPNCFTIKMEGKSKELTESLPGRRPSEPPSRPFAWLILTVALAAAVALILHFRGNTEKISPSPSIHSLNSLPDLLALPPERLAQVPIARMNLLCAQGLSAHTEPDV